MNNRELLTSNGNGLKIFNEGVSVCYDYPKWKKAKKDRQGNAYFSATADGSSTALTTSNMLTTVTFGTPDDFDPAKKESFNVLLDKITVMSIEELNAFIKEHNIMFYLSKTGAYDYRTNNSFEWGVVGDKETSSSKKKAGFFSRLFNSIMGKKKEKYEFDVIDFFTKVKTTTKESTEEYVNRITKYIRAINMSIETGQVALREKLLREMVANKYDALLVAEGYYHVIKEEQIVDFIKKCEKGLALDYIKNFTRPVPAEVGAAIKKANALEVFDNYVVLHYDPEKTAYKETAKEENKRRDPILFGVIAGSSKLYYITDWVDDYCDLTLEKFVDTLGISKDDLIENMEKRKEVAPKKEKSVAPKKPLSKPRKKTVKKENKKKQK